MIFNLPKINARDPLLVLRVVRRHELTYAQQLVLSAIFLYG